MRSALLFSIFILLSMFALCQTKGNDQNFEKGVTAFQSGNYKEAISLFTQSIYEYPSASNSFFNRAVSYYYLRDSCNFCADLKMASSLGHPDAPKLYDDNCIFKRIIQVVPDSVKLKYTDALRLEVVKSLCSTDSVVKVVSMRDGNIWTEEISNTEQNGEGEIFTIVENMPQYPGGEEAFNRFLAENIIYPNLAAQNGIEGIVIVGFVIEKDGRVTDVKIMRGIGAGCDDEAYRVVKLMPKWIPGTQAGKAVRVQFNMPIYYKLEGPGIPKSKN